MIKRNNIFVLSRQHFKEMISELTEQQFMDSAFISIHEPIRGNEPESKVILSDAPNVLNLWFDDCEEDFELPNGLKCQLFTPEMAMQVFKFVNENRSAKQWFVHYTMGKCRSGAIGEVLAEYFEIDYFGFKRDNPRVQPNVLVKKLLRTAFQLTDNIFA